MAIKYFILVFLMSAPITSEKNERLVLHSDLDISSVINELRQENQALKAQMTQEMSALKAELTLLRKGQGSTYIRWGRTSCEGNETQKVYSGYAAGSGYTIPGGASSTLCLPESPSWATYKDGIDGIGGYIYGSEYDGYESTFNSFGKHICLMKMYHVCFAIAQDRPTS